MLITCRGGTKRFFASTANADHQQTKKMSQAQRAAFHYYRRQREDTLWNRLFGSWFKTNNKKKKMMMMKTGGGTTTTTTTTTQQQRNINTAWYAAAIVVGALGATYAAVPLYKVFCQTTGFGGTTQRVRIGSTAQELEQEEMGPVERFVQSAVNQISSTLPISIFSSSSSSLLGSSSRTTSTARVHTWTDEEAAAKLASLKPVKNADLITIRFDTTVDDIMPWTFEPVQLDVKVVPGETALSFFRVTNKSDKAITGVATYNVHPPKVGLYFQKVQCFCFEEQRLLPGETVDMPVFFFIDPEIVEDSQVSYVRSVTLSYFFHQTDVEDEEEEEEEEERKS